jgi:hypothetical protein
VPSVAGLRYTAPELLRLPAAAAAGAPLPPHSELVRRPWSNSGGQTAALVKQQGQTAVVKSQRSNSAGQTAVVKHSAGEPAARGEGAPRGKARSVTTT